MDGLGLEAGPTGRVRVEVGRSVALCLDQRVLMDGSRPEVGRIRPCCGVGFFFYFFFPAVGVLGVSFLTLFGRVFSLSGARWVVLSGWGLPLFFEG